jgi:hypothetical protein
MIVPAGQARPRLQYVPLCQRYIARAKAANTPIIGPKHSEKETPELIEN